MKNKSRIIGLLLVGSLFVTTIANAEVFSATKPGFGGDVMVSITVEDQKIVDCQIAGDQETAGIGSRAVEEMPALIVAGEGNADVVSGATITSNAILEALGDAMVQSGLREADSGEIAYTPGTYTAVVAARNGEMTVETTFSEDTIERIEILSHIETPGVSDVALERVPSEIIELQTLDVDTTTGATVSRAAVIAAVRNCVEQAGGNVSALLNNRVRPEVSQEVQTIETDVVVVGGGLAGLSAAVSASENGADVILIERQANLGGSSIVASGLFHFGDTALQKAHGIEDTPEAFEQALHAAAALQNGSRDPVQVHMVAYEGGATVDWLMDQGVQFDPDYIDYIMGSPDVPRAIRVIPNTASLIYPLEDAAKANGATIYTEMLATEITVDESGAVTGVNATNAKGEHFRFVADRTVLATGGYRANNDLTMKYLGQEYDGLIYSGVPGNKGEMLDFAIGLGADTYQLDKPFLSPTYTWDGKDITSNVLSKGGILVDSKAERYCNETASYLQTSLDTIALGEPGNKVYEIFDEHVHEVERDTHDYFNWGIVIEGETVEELAEKIGLDPAALRSTIDAYNTMSRGEAADPYGRSIITPEGLSQAPYYAIEVYPGGTLSGGGLKVNEHLQVVKTDGDIMEGLYAVGEVSGGYRAFGYAGGDSLSHAAVSGRLAGAFIAEELR